MAMRVLGIVAIDHPLLKLTPAADCGPQQLCPLGCQRIAKIFVDAQGVGGFDRIGENVPDELLIV